MKQGSREQTGFAKDLKPVAYSQDSPAVIGMLNDRLHNGAKTGNRTATQVIAVAETAWKDKGFGPFQVSLLVPKLNHFKA